MSFWINFWTIVLIVGLTIFAGLAIVVSIGGVFNIRSLFKSLADQHSEPTTDASDPPSSA